MLASKWRQLASETCVPTAELQSVIYVGVCFIANATRMFKTIPTV